MSTHGEIMEVFWSEVNRCRLPRISSRVIERAAERQERNERQPAGVVELEHYHRRRARKALGFVATMLLVAVSLAAQVQRAPGPITLAWDASVSEGVIGYLVRQGDQPGVYASPAVDVGAALQWTTPALAVGTYYFVVAAYNATDESPNSWPELVVQIAEPDPPPPISTLEITNVALTQSRFGQATITWRTNEAATDRVEYGQSNPPELISPLTATSLVGKFDHSVTLTGLKRHRTYFYRAFSQKADGTAAQSAVGSFYSRRGEDMAELIGTVEAPAEEMAAKQIAVERHRINCPYCPIGFAMIFVERHGKEVQIPGMHDPRRCESCGKYFMLRPVVKITGVRMEEANGNR